MRLRSLFLWAVLAIGFAAFGLWIQQRMAFEARNVPRQANTTLGMLVMTYRRNTGRWPKSVGETLSGVEPWQTRVFQDGPWRITARNCSITLISSTPEKATYDWSTYGSEMRRVNMEWSDGERKVDAYWRAVREGLALKRER